MYIYLYMSKRTDHHTHIYIWSKSNKVCYKDKSIYLSKRTIQQLIYIILSLCVYCL